MKKTLNLKALKIKTNVKAGDVAITLKYGINYEPPVLLRYGIALPSK